MGNLYDVLGLSPDASSAAIKAAYYSLAKQYHPDTHAGATAAQQRIREINRAYEVLADPLGRAAYDLMLERQRAVAQTRFWRSLAAGAVAFALTIGSVPLLVLWQQSRTGHQETTKPAGAAVNRHAEGTHISIAESEHAASVLALGNDAHDESALSAPPQPVVAPVPPTPGSARAPGRKQLAWLAKWKSGVARTREHTQPGARTPAGAAARNYQALRAYVLSK